MMETFELTNYNFYSNRTDMELITTIVDSLKEILEEDKKQEQPLFLKVADDFILNENGQKTLNIVLELENLSTTKKQLNYRAQLFFALFLLSAFLGLRLCPTRFVRGLLRFGRSLRCIFSVFIGFMLRYRFLNTRPFSLCISGLFSSDLCGRLTEMLLL